MQLEITFEINRHAFGQVAFFYLRNQRIAELEIVTSMAERNIKVIKVKQKFATRREGHIFYYENRVVDSKNKEDVFYWLEKLESELDQTLL